jgi:hypothetical protein
VTYLTFPQLERVGRLGNQLWQIASTLGLARRYGYEPRFPPTWSYRPFLSIPDEFFEPATARCLEAVVLDDLNHLDARTRIYMQDLSFIEGVEDEIWEWFLPSERAREQMNAALPSAWVMPVLVIHVRRGDNLNAQHCYPIPSMNYYLGAVETHPRHDVVIFGDDGRWNRDVLKPTIEKAYDNHVQTVHGVPRPKEHEPDYMTAPILDWIDLFAMVELSQDFGAFCLSNSTLGWWSAWLANCHDVCYPDPWYGPALDKNAEGYIDGSLMMPKTWRKTNAA